MADHWAREELHESEASKASVICFDRASQEQSYFVADLVCFILLFLALCFWMPPKGIEIFSIRCSKM